jgi:hypothetical protein
MRDNNNEYQSMKMNRATQAVVLENVALKIRYHVSKFLVVAGHSKSFIFNFAFHGIEEIKHNLAETSEINHNLAKNSGRAFWLRDRMRLAFGQLRARSGDSLH